MNNNYNFLTFDIEEWYYGNFQSVDLSKYRTQKTNLESNVDKLIDICSEYNIKSTCFVVGKLAQKKPYVVKKLQRAGHEIASHSYNHRLIYNMTPEEFNEDLKKSCSILEDIIGEKVIGFRAPSWSVNESIVNWFYDILDENGIKYSSSVYSAKTYLYGIPNFPQKIHHPIINGVEKNVIEIPQNLVNIFGKKIGFSGGFFLRLFPAWFINKNITKKNKSGENVFFYLHPHEIDSIQQKIGLNLKENFIFNYGIKNCERKLKLILSANKNNIKKIKEYLDGFDEK